jgi:hypothetical protein
LEGFAINPPACLTPWHAIPQLSCHVIDTAWNYRLVATYTTENYRAAGRYGVRQRARAHAERLNSAC